MDTEILKNPEKFHEHINALKGEAPNTSPEDEGGEAHDDEVESVELDDDSEEVGETDDSEDGVEAEQEESEEEDAGDEESDDDDKRSNKIPRSRFDKALEDRDKARIEARDERDARIKAETELAQYKQAIEMTLAGDDPEEEWTDEVAKQKYEELKSEWETDKKQTKEESEKARAAQYLTHTLQNQQAVFEKSHPDFNDAYQHLAKVEYNKFKRIYGEQEADRRTGTYLLNVAATAVSEGRDAAELIYDMAKDVGYRKAKPGANLDNIEKNQKRSPNGVKRASVGANGMAGVDAMRVRPNGPIDPAKFHKNLQKILQAAH